MFPQNSYYRRLNFFSQFFFFIGKQNRETKKHFDYNKLPLKVREIDTDIHQVREVLGKRYTFTA